jgi:hypothetical protein
MNTTTTRLIAAGMLFLFTVLSGVVVSKGGRPYNAAVFGIHKLVALATVILLALVIRQQFKSGDAGALLELGVIVITGALFLTLIVTGALLSLDLQLPAAVLRIHQVAPILTLVSSVIAVVLLINTRA